MKHVSGISAAKSSVRFGDRWHVLVENSRPGTDRWFRGKYSVALLRYRLNDPAQAERIIGLVEVLHPTMGGPEMKARFDRLRELCRQARRQ